MSNPSFTSPSWLCCGPLRVHLVFFVVFFQFSWGVLRINERFSLPFLASMIMAWCPDTLNLKKDCRFHPIQLVKYPGWVRGPWNSPKEYWRETRPGSMYLPIWKTLTSLVGWKFQCKPQAYGMYVSGQTYIHEWTDLPTRELRPNVGSTDIESKPQITNKILNNV